MAAFGEPCREAAAAPAFETCNPGVHNMAQLWDMASIISLIWFKVYSLIKPYWALQDQRQAGMPKSGEQLPGPPKYPK